MPMRKGRRARPFLPIGRQMSRPAAMLLACVVAVGVATRPAAQAPLDQLTGLDSRAAAATEALFPGFAEVLRSPDTAWLRELGQALSRRPSPESMSMLVWMMQHREHWGSDPVRLGAVVKAVGTLPMAGLADVM